MPLPTRHQIRVNISPEIHRELLWMEFVAIQSPHSFILDAIAERLDRVRPNFPRMPANWKMPQSDDAD
jgi:hypothetical protein